MPPSPRSATLPDAPRRKLGLALSGGGFRASLYHLGVLRRLAELDLLRRVEVISTVSGGSIVGALYALLVKREMERSGRLGRGDYLAIVDELTRLTKEGIRANPRARLLLDPVAVAGSLVGSGGLGRRMARLYGRHFFAPVVDDLEGVDARDGRLALPDLRIRPGGGPLEGGSIEAHNRARMREIRAGEPAAVVPQLVLNATSLNSGERFRFTAVDVGDPRLGHVRRDEAGVLLDRKRLLDGRIGELAGAGAGAPAYGGLEGLHRELRASDGAPPGVEIRGSASPLRTVALARWWRDGDRDRVPPGWEELRGRLAHLPACLARAELGTLREAKLAAWHLRKGRAPEAGPDPEGDGHGTVTTGHTAREHWRRLHAGLEEIDPRLHGRAVARWVSGTHRPDRRARGRLLLDLVLETYWIRTGERVSRSLKDDWRRLTLADAVAASAAFPPVFAPTRLPGIWDDDHVPRLTLTDGGVFDNMGIVALLEQACDHVVASDAGGRFRWRAKGPVNRLAGAARSIGVLRKAVAGFQRAQMRERRRVSRSLESLLSTPPRSEPVERGLRQVLARRRLSGLAYFHIGSPRERPALRGGPAADGAEDDGRAGDGRDGTGRPHPPPHMGLDTDLLAGVRTDLDVFGEVEAAALIDRGYETADQYVRSFLRETLGSRDWEAEDRRPRLPEPLPSRERVHRVLRAGSARFLRPARLLRLERPAVFWTAAVAALAALGTGGLLAAGRAGWSPRGALEAAADALPWVAGAPVALLVAAGALGLVVGAAGLVSGRIYRRMTRVGDGTEDRGRDAGAESGPPPG